MESVFDSLGYVLAQNFLISLCIPLMVATYCRRRSGSGRVFIIALSFAILWVLWVALVRAPVQPQWALFLACVAVYVFIRSVSRRA